MGLKVERDLLFLAFIREDRTYKEHETIRRHTIVELETLLGRCDGSQDRETVDTRFDVRRRPVLLREHGRDTGDLILYADVSRSTNDPGKFNVPLGG